MGIRKLGCPELSKLHTVASHQVKKLQASEPLKRKKGYADAPAPTDPEVWGQEAIWFPLVPISMEGGKVVGGSSTSRASPVEGQWQLAAAAALVAAAAPAKAAAASSAAGGGGYGKGPSDKPGGRAYPQCFQSESVSQFVSTWETWAAKSA